MSGRREMSLDNLPSEVRDLRERMEALPSVCIFATKALPDAGGV